MMKRNLLFADNETGIRNYCRQELEAEGYRVLLASDGLEALEILDACIVDLVILDEHMPRCGGLETAKRIRQWYPQLPILLFTADEDFERYQSPLADAAIIKSQDISRLKAKIAKLLSSQHGVAGAAKNAPQLAGIHASS